MEQSISFGLKSSDDYFVHQFNTACLAQFSYYIESNKEAIIIDPIRDSDIYVDMLNKRGATLKYIVETHFHADFVSGHIELQNLKGGQIVFGPNATPGYEALIVEDGQLLELGKISLKVIHTPGHTLESTSFLLLDPSQTPLAVFTGDCLFLGEVGRPDLAVKANITERDLANMLYESLQRLKALNDDVIVYPGHGAGSACGKKISAGSYCSIGNQKKNNYALNENLIREEFIEIVTSNVPTPPQYFFYDVMLNKKGYDTLEHIVTRSLVPISMDKIFDLAYSQDTVVIDTRNFGEAIKGFVKGSYVISLQMTYAIWTATLFNPEQKIVLITDKGKEKESVIRLARVGYENVVGYVEGGFEAVKEYATKNGLEDKISSLVIPDLSKVNQYLQENLSNIYILDVREKSELESTGVVAQQNAHFIPLGILENNLTELKKTTLPIGIHCKTGGRASLAASILKRHDINDIVFLGGIGTMIEKGVPLIPYENK
jgi:glyoxylase-like metal-dependent hydrolase (beta-lactamase superfamily II)/rhodanese-related sulfurtransferase